MNSNDLKSLLVEQVMADPGLPRENPTDSFWQQPPHLLATVRSETPAARSYFVIIGSGMTGFSIAKTILEHPKFQQTDVTVLESRTLCSGATGRNGGGMASPILYYFHHLVAEVGEAQAVSFARFVYKNLAKMHELGNLSERVRQASEIRRVRDVAGFRDAETRADIMASIAMLKKLVPEADLNVEEISTEEAEETYKQKGLVGAMLVNAGVNWPYRLIVELWDHYLNQYPGRLGIETNTAVLDIARDESDYPYILTTSRGTIRAKHVIHATNGYAGHLLPALRGIIVPCRSMMSAHQRGTALSAVDNTSFSNFGQTSYKPHSGILQGYVYYGHQNPYTGDVFWGGDTDEGTGIFTADDSVVSSTAQNDIYASIPKHLVGDEDFKPKSIWTGIQGNTVDQFPLVGSIPEAYASGRAQSEDSKEWICAGFNGAGMSQCLLSGEGLVKMIAGEDISEALPELLIVTEARLRALDPKDHILKTFPNL